MQDLWIKNNYAKACRYNGRDRCGASGVRVYRQSPYAANLQIWSQTDNQAIASNCPLNAAQCFELARKLIEIAGELKDEKDVAALIAS